VQIEPDNTLYQYAYGEMLRINKKYDDAVAAYKKAATGTPPHPKANAKLGMALFEAGKLSDAEVSLSDAVRADPQNPFNYFNLGIVYGAEKKYKLAIEAMENFLKLADKDDGDRPKATECVKELKKGKKCAG
jgi:predicted Zn-dependent protease